VIRSETATGIADRYLQMTGLEARGQFAVACAGLIAAVAVILRVIG